MNLQKIEHLLNELIAEIRVIKCCDNCQHFDIPLQLCKKANMKPPEQVLRNGCESYILDRNSPPF